MNFDEYQAAALRTAGHRGILLLGAVGIAGEGGELLDEVKKVTWHGKALDVDRLVEELGDALWYHAYLADALGVSLDEVARRNVEKLRKRYPDGFSVEMARMARGGKP